MRFSINSKTSGKYTEETINGRNHIVTTMRPIVGDISMNKVFYPNAEVKKSYTQLNNLPAPNGHPKINGVHVTAFSPLAMNAFNVGGFIRNPKMKNKEVYAEFVIDETVANTSDDGKEIIRRIKENEKIGVSTGLNIQQVTNASGKDDLGVEYERTGSGFNFDHVAILLNEKAAGEHAGTELVLNTEDDNDPIYVVNLDVGSINELSVDELRDDLNGLLRKNNSDKSDVWITEIFPESKHIIWSVYQDGEYRLFKQSYRVDTIDGKENAVLLDDVSQVVLKKEFKPTTTNQEDDEMNKEILVLSIIASVNNSFTNDDKERLTAMNESELVKALETPVDDNQAKEVLTNSGFDFKGYDSFVANKDAFESFLKAENEKLDALKTEIVANSDYTVEMLEGKTSDELDTINGLVEKSKSAVRVGEGQSPSKTVASINSYDM
jgi:hypothetical protein